MKWTKAEERILWDNPDKSNEWLALQINKPEATIATKRSRMGITSIANRWTVEEEQIMKDFYNEVALADLHLLLPERNIASIRAKARAMRKRGKLK